MDDISHKLAVCGYTGFIGIAAAYRVFKTDGAIPRDSLSPDMVMVLCVENATSKRDAIAKTIENTGGGNKVGTSVPMKPGVAH